MEKQNEPAIKEGNTPKKRVVDRSPGYPGIDLKTAIDRARELYNKERQNSANVEVVVRHWGYKNAKVGPALITIAAMKRFGILETQGLGDKKEAKLSATAIRILRDERAESPERDELIRAAALTPEIHSQLWKEYNGHLPSDENLRHNLRLEKGFSDTGADEFIKEFRSTIAFANLDKSTESPYIDDEENAQQEELKDQQEGKSTPTKSSDQKVLVPPSIIAKSGTEMRTYPITFLDGTQGSFTIPLPMSKEDWIRMKKQLDFQLEMLEPVHVQNKANEKAETSEK